MIYNRPMACYKVISWFLLLTLTTVEDNEAIGEKRG